MRVWILCSVAAAGIFLLSGVHELAVWLLALGLVSVPCKHFGSQQQYVIEKTSEPCDPSVDPVQPRWAAAAGVASILLFIALIGKRDFIIPSTWPRAVRSLLLLSFTALLAAWGRPRKVLLRATFLGCKHVLFAALGSFFVITVWADTTTAFLMLRTALLPALSEELVFRVLLPTLILASLPMARASTAFGRLIAAVIAQALFALAHAVVVWRGPKELIRLFTAGLFYDQLVSRGALVTAILLHTVTNYVVGVGRGQEQPRGWILACILVVAYFGSLVRHDGALASRRYQLGSPRKESGQSHDAELCATCDMIRARDRDPSTGDIQ
jgi:hypothetical protein